MKNKTVNIRCHQCKKWFKKDRRMYCKAKRRKRVGFFCSIKCLKEYQSILFATNPKESPHKCSRCTHMFRGKCRLCRSCRKSFKICILCKRLLPKIKYKDSFCPACRSQYQTSIWIRKKIKAIKYLGGTCKDCRKIGPEDYYLLDFHHRDRKKKDVAWNNIRKRSWPRILSEISKCDLLCSNCHRRRHHKEGYYIANRKHGKFVVPPAGIEPASPL